MESAASAARARPASPEPNCPSEPAIDVRGVRHVYRARAEEVEALLSLDLSVRPGEMLAIVGPSGCGKSTLLRIIAGLLAPTAGSVRLDGRHPAEAHQRHTLGWLAQDDGLFPWRTVAANVALPLSVGAAAPGHDEPRSPFARWLARALRNRPTALDTGHGRAVERVLRAVGLYDAANRFPYELSGGMRQRAALARALVYQPFILLLDEPFAHLDEITRERLGDLLLDLRRVRPDVPPPTTVLVTHSVAEAVRLADRVVVFSSRPGRVLLDLRLDLPHPRRDDQPEVGRCIQRLKTLLLGRTSTVDVSDAHPDGALLGPAQAAGVRTRSR